MKKFATISTTDELLRLTSELLELGVDYEVIFVPYRPEILAELIEIIPDKKTGKRNFTQTRLAEEATAIAVKLGYDKKHWLSQKTISSYCLGEFMPTAVGLEIMGKALGVYLVPGLDDKVDARQVLDYIKNLHS